MHLGEPSLITTSGLPCFPASDASTVKTYVSLFNIRFNVRFCVRVRVRVHVYIN